MDFLRRTAHPWALCLLVFAASTAPVSAEPISAILQRAEQQVGTPYRSGGIAPGGFDCSGFVSWLYRPTLPSIPRISRDMARSGSPVPSGEWEQGDLLFYATGSDPNRINHVAVWYGDGRVIHSISDGPETGVVITPYHARYWERRYMGARRVLPAESIAGAAEESPGSDAPSPKPEPAQALPAVEDSPWNDFDGILRGDFEAWKQADEEAFEAYKKENG